jgi:ketosteroid isomerase-like protein
MSNCHPDSSVLFFLRNGWVLLFCLIVTGCGTHSQGTKAAEAQKISALMMEQQDAWNSGDVSEFMTHYWKSDSLQFIGRRGLTNGWQATLDNYLLSYTGQSDMGRLNFTNYSVDVLDHSNAFVTGKWELFREADTLAGYYTLLWKKKADKWVIVSDHSS